MHSVPPVLTTLRTALPRIGRPFRDVARLTTESGGDDQSRPREAARGLGGFDPDSLPPYETIEVGPRATDAPGHGVVVWNDGPKRTLSVSVRSAGGGASVAESRLVDAGGVVRLALGRPDRYEVTVAAPGRATYAVDIEPEWFGAGASVTNVRVCGDGYVRYAPL